MSTMYDEHATQCVKVLADNFAKVTEGLADDAGTPFTPGYDLVQLEGRLLDELGLNVHARYGEDGYDHPEVVRYRELAQLVSIAEHMVRMVQAQIDKVANATSQ